ncbi:hypothetical protein BGP78_10935 [Pseudoalteromonas sp. MSK9-3]|uniref:type II secretion system protein GspK n=1 Tax=Pseudoalteromonas sp. MSK9-3 TaxID=1897633 RepID=UPI000EC4CC48|nr:type II secretion system protein GspK [Pseudoalteromonas sp. MSK9-3]RJE76910.1 hypothetical protein BGP78_10935 [Pseudoalteromonas sp. MSK9-3]
MKQQFGIALLQVLIITMILSTVALFITKTAKQQIAYASLFNDKTAALVLYRDTRSKVLYKLLTETSAPTEIPDWNVYGRPFSVTKNASVWVQDLSGMLDIHYINQSKFMKLLESLGYNEDEAFEALNKIKDWQDENRISLYFHPEPDYKNGAIHDTSELYRLNLREDLVNMMKSNSTVHKGGRFNPMNSPDSLLRGILPSNVAEQVIAERTTSDFSTRRFSIITGIVESDRVVLYTSNNFQVNIEAKVGTAVIAKKEVFKLKPTKNSPVNVVEKVVYKYD